MTRPMSVEAEDLAHDIGDTQVTCTEDGDSEARIALDDIVEWESRLNDLASRLRRDREALRKVRDEMASENTITLNWADKHGIPLRAWLAALDEILEEET